MAMISTQDPIHYIGNGADTVPDDRAEKSQRREVSPVNEDSPVGEPANPWDEVTKPGQG